MVARFVILGRSKTISKQETRAWIWASLVVLQYHNLFPVESLLRYCWKRKLIFKGEAVDGLAWRSQGLVELDQNQEPQDAFTTILHETIHLCAEFKDGAVEACTSTLCNRLKPDVAKIAEILVKGTYKRAAAVAHCKISYPPKAGDDDFYNKSQSDPVPWQERYRNKHINKR